MEPNLVVSLGSAVAIFSMFYSMHKDSKKNTEVITDLKARVKSLETKQVETDNALKQLLDSVQEIKVALAKIDTKLTGLESDYRREHNRNSEFRDRERTG